MEKVLQRVARGMAACRADGDTPKVVLLSEAFREVFSGVPHARTCFGLELRWTAAKPMRPDVLIRTAGGDLRIAR